MTDSPPADRPTRSAHLRITGRMDDPSFRDALRELAALHTAAAQTLEVSMYAADDAPAPEAERHPERDALLALADEWSNNGLEDSYGEALADAAIRLTRLVATLDL